ncbi:MULTISPECIES: magnesium and cobalt transport protein CorA [Aphanothece]|uniref:magnesium and cobalt transport protein CorA n=1 Tax=Aphanothece TaxID=1121 RepID=UPI0039854E5E
MLRPTPGALTSRRMEERPAGVPSQLYVHGGHQPTHFSVMVFDGETPRLEELSSPAALNRIARQGTPLWLRVSGLAEPQRIRDMLTALDIPELLLPPLLETPQRPRVDGLDEALLVVLHRLGFACDPTQLISSQLGMVLLPNRLITVEEATIGAPFGELTGWLLARVGAVEDRDLDDILHFLVDEVLDDLFPMLEQITNRLDDLEEAALKNPTPRLLSRAFQYRSNLRRIRSLIWPLRHEIRTLLSQRQRLLGEAALAGFREMADLVELLFENGELLRHQCDAITQTYAASVGNRMNQVMKTLTILTSIFAPLTFICGIYGMNFAHIPELTWRFGYPYALLLMATIAAIQAWWLWRRGWFQDWTSPH